MTTYPRRSRRGPAVIVGVLAAIALSLLLLLSTGAFAAAPEPDSAQIACPAGADLILHPDHTWQCGTAPTTDPTVDPTASSSPTTSPTPTPSPSTSTITPSPSTTTSSALTTIKAYITGYSWFDNTPAGSAAISNPVLHQTAGGTGTYADPITVAVGHSIIMGLDLLDWAQGTRFYIPNLRRYFIVEDTCGDGRTPQNGPCHNLAQADPGAQTWLDVWVGGKGGTSGGADRCMDKITAVHTVIVDPADGYPVVTGDIYRSSGCTTQYGDTVPSA